jgi:hypothetical protein
MRFQPSHAVVSGPVMTSIGHPALTGRAGVSTKNAGRFIAALEDPEKFMRKFALALAAVAAVAFASAVPAEAGHKHRHHYKPAKVAPVAGVVVGTVVGVGLYEGWFAVGTLGTTTAGSVAGGLLAGIGTAALIHAATTKCAGFHALAGGSGCVNGKYVGHHYKHKKPRKWKWKKRARR